MQFGKEKKTKYWWTHFLSKKTFTYWL